MFEFLSTQRTEKLLETKLNIPMVGDGRKGRAVCVRAVPGCVESVRVSGYVGMDASMDMHECWV
jgi:hypothetical protein